MKTILCPVDLTPSSDRVAKYAAELARDTNAKVVLVAAHAKNQKVAAGDWSDDKGEMADRLNELHDLLTTTYQIPCAIEDEVISTHVHKRLNLLADSYDIMILGMRFSKSGFPGNQAGIDLVRIIQSGLAPLLIVPELYEYKTVKRILYAYDYKHEQEPPLLQLHWLARWFGTDVRFVSILQSNISTQEKDKLTTLQNKIAVEWKSNMDLTFENIVYDDVAEGFELYLGLWRKQDLLVLSVNHKNMLERLWNKSVVRRILKYAARPYFIIHK